jgi:hypothetical protein
VVVGLSSFRSLRGCTGESSQEDSLASRAKADAGMTTEDELETSGTVGIIGVGRDGRDEEIDVVEIAYVMSSCVVPRVGNGDAGDAGT